MEASLKLLRDEGMANVAARHHRCAGSTLSEGDPSRWMQDTRAMRPCRIASGRPPKAR